MPVPVETLRSMKKMHVVFAATAVVTLLTMLWMMKSDYDRPWREMQSKYFDLRSGLAHFTVMAYDSPEEKTKRAEMEKAVADADAVLAADEMRKKTKELEERRTTLEGQLQAVNLDFGNLNAEIQVTAFQFEEMKTLHGPKDKKTVEAKEKYEAQEEKLTVLKEAKDALADEIDAVKRELKSLYAPRVAAQKKLDVYLKGLADARKRDEMYGPGIKREAFNLPGFDFLAPKDTPGREEIRQIFTQDVRFNYNYLDSYQTDRCMTCHVGIDNPDLAEANFVEQGRKALQSPAVADKVRDRNIKIRETLSAKLAAAEPKVDNPALAAMSPEERGRFVDGFVLEANAYLRSIGRPELSTPRALASLKDKQDLTRGTAMDYILQETQKILSVVPPTKGETAHRLDYDEMSEEQKKEYRQALLAALNDYLDSVGRPRIVYEKVLRAHPQLDQYVSAKSAHPMKKIGCTVCHQGSGQETDFVLAAHTPETHAQEREWEEKYYVRQAGVPENTFHLVEEYWEYPMYPSDYLSAGCRKCHSQVNDLERSKTKRVVSEVVDRGAPHLHGGSSPHALGMAHETADPDEADRKQVPLRLVEGRELFTTVGCINCHDVSGLSDSRRVGPDLAHIGEKLTLGFMEKWIDYPANFRPSTRMPHFFHQENNLPSSKNPDDPNPVLRTESEIEAIAHYLKTFSTPYGAQSPPDGMTGDAKHGEELFTSIGCLACHANLDAHDPTDDAGRTFGERWITTELEMADGKSAEDAKAEFDAMSKNDRSRFAMRRFESYRRERAQQAAEEEKLAADAAQRDPDPKKLYVPPEFTRFGPDLSGLGSKLLPDAGNEDRKQQAEEWLYNWLRDPRHFSTTSKMPQLFKDNYYWSLPPADRDAHRDQDILDLAAYLLSLRHDEFDQTPFADDEAHRAEQLRLSRMLLSGLNTGNVVEQYIGDEKAFPNDKYGRLTQAILQQTSASFGGSDEGETAAYGLFHNQGLADRQKLYFGMKMISHYGCYACHNIPGFEAATRPGTELTTWGQKFISQLDFAFYSPPFHDEIERQPDVFGMLYPESAEYEHLVRDLGQNLPQQILHNHAAFAYHKLRNPRIWDRAKIKKPYDKLKMPNFYFTDEETRSLVTWLLSLRDPLVTNNVKIHYETSPAGKIAAGRALVRELNCVACHPIERNTAYIRQYYKDDPGLSDADPVGKRFTPPLLWGEGAKVQPPWLHTFLDQVEMLRPWLKIRMPSFHLTTDERRTIVEYFVGLAQDESHMLHDELNPVYKAMADAHGGLAPTTALADADAAAPGADWFTLDAVAREAEFLPDWAVRHNQVTPFELEPPSPTATPREIVASLIPTYDKIVHRASFLSNVFDADYPFPRRTAPPLSDNRFKLGEEMFFDLKCLACHVAGDPSLPGTTTDIKAPNFALTHSRLRYDWVIQWLQDPQAIQPGANMPQIFQGGSAFASASEDERKAMEAKFGDTVTEQANLLVGFLFELGNRRYTAIQPGAAEAATESTGEGGEVEFDFGGGGEATSAPTSQPAGDVEFEF